MLTHVLPNVIGPVLVIATLNLGFAILAEATLSFLGVGVPPTQPSLGTLIRIGNDFLFCGEWWITIFPGRRADLHGAVGQPAGRLAARRAEPEAPLMAGPILEVRDLRVEFPTRRGTLTALDDVSFDIAPGEVLGVVGESGAGKSMTGAAIIGLLEPPGRIAGGQILLNGRRIDNLPYEQMRRIRGRRDRRDLPGPADHAEPALHRRPPADRDDADASAAVRRGGPRSAPSAGWRWSASPPRRSASTATRTNSPAACASASSSRSRCAPSRS